MSFDLGFAIARNQDLTFTGCESCAFADKMDCDDVTPASIK